MARFERGDIVKIKGCTAIESGRTKSQDTNGMQQIESRGVLQEEYAIAESGW
jgi:hypothetical protein